MRSESCVTIPTLRMPAYDREKRHFFLIISCFRILAGRPGTLPVQMNKAHTDPGILDKSEGFCARHFYPGIKKNNLLFNCTKESIYKSLVFSIKLFTKFIKYNLN